MLAMNFKLVFLLPLIICAGNRVKHSLENFPDIQRMGALMTDIMLFSMYSGSTNYDAYFFSPALLTLPERDFQDSGFLQFFGDDFNLKVHANDFQFSDSETKEEFGKRFIRYIADSKKVPSKIRHLAEKFVNHVTVPPFAEKIDGFFKPCPLYAFVRAITLVAELDLGIFSEMPQDKLASLNVIIGYLMKEFDPESYGIDSEASVMDIMATLGHLFARNGQPLELSDGTSARLRNKELFERLQTEEAVPEAVKKAIAVLLPLLLENISSRA